MAFKQASILQSCKETYAEFRTLSEEQQALFNQASGSNCLFLNKHGEWEPLSTPKVTPPAVKMVMLPEPFGQEHTDFSPITRCRIRCNWYPPESLGSLAINDLSLVQPGDYVWSVFYGKVTVDKVHPGTVYPIVLTNTDTFTLEGWSHVADKYPTIFRCRPNWFDTLDKLTATK